MEPKYQTLLLMPVLLTCFRAYSILTCDHTLPPLYSDAGKEGMIHLLAGSYVKNQILFFFSVIGRETMLMKRCVLIGFHISTSFPVKKLVWLEENRMGET